MIGAIADGRFAYYLALGMVATVNPCGFAMLPAYLSYFLGAESTPSGPDAGLGRAAQVGLAVSGGFLAVFAVAGTLVEVADIQVAEYTPWISIVIGLALLALGIAMVAGFELVVRLPKLERGGRSRTVPSMFVFGVSYAIASIGCSLPIFLSAVAGTTRRESFVDGLVVLAIYAAGMALVLVTLTVAIALARTSVVRFLRSTQPYINRAAGTLVALAGGYVAYYGLLELRTYRSRGTSVPSSSITDTVTGWSYDIADWVQRVGAVRLGTALALILLAIAAATTATRTRRSAD
ncbi:MAG: cytochrome c biogenesis CcdA family protein [Acidimicrobiales bacterium]